MAHGMSKNSPFNAGCSPPPKFSLARWQNWRSRRYLKADGRYPHGSAVLIFGTNFMGHTVFRAPSLPERRRDEAMGQEFEDVISCCREDDHVIAEMLGITSDRDYYCPRRGRPGKISTTTVLTSSVVNDAPEYQHYDKTWLIGVIRRAKRMPLRFQGPWLKMKELRDCVKKKRPAMHLGVRGLLHIAQTDNKQRFQFRGRLRDPRCDCVGQAYYSLWVSAGHGHH